MNIPESSIEQLEISLTKLKHQLESFDTRTDERAEEERNSPIYKWIKQQVHRIECEILERTLLK